MNLRKLTLGVVMAAAISLTAASCKPKDADVKAQVETALADKDIMVDVTSGVATLSGTVATDAEKAAFEEKAKAVKGVKSVTNNISVAPVTVDPDAELLTKVQDAVKAYPTVTASVSGGMVTLTGDVTKEELTKVMQAVSALNVGKIDNKMNIKK